MTNRLKILLWAVTLWTLPFSVFAQSTQKDATNTHGENIDTATEKQSFREALDLWTDDSVSFGSLLGLTDVATDGVTLSGTVPAASEGLFYYDSTEKTHVAINDITGNKLNVGQENWKRVINKTGVLIPNGSVVYQNGFDIPSDKPTIALAQADAEATSNVMGITTGDIADGAEGHVTTMGRVRDLDTSGFSTSDLIYLSPTVAGGYTATKPSRPNRIVEVGEINKAAGGTAGSLDVGLLLDNGAYQEGDDAILDGLTLSDILDVNGATWDGFQISGAQQALSIWQFDQPIEIGNSTDTTLSRSAAGRLAVEGVNIPTISSTDTFTNKEYSGGTLTGTFAGDHTLSGDLTLQSLSSTTVPLRIDLAASQTGNALEVYNASSQLLSGFTSSGGYFFNRKGEAQGFVIADQFAPGASETRTSFGLRGAESESLYINAGRTDALGVGEIVLGNDVVGPVRLKGSLVDITPSTVSLTGNPTISGSPTFSGVVNTTASVNVLSPSNFTDNFIVRSSLGNVNIQGGRIDSTRDPFYINFDRTNLDFGNGHMTVSSAGAVAIANSLTMNGDIAADKTITAAATTGAQTINKNAGSVNFAAAATSLVVTNSRVTANSVIICTVGTNDSTLTSVQAVAAAGSFTLYANAAATAETRVNFLVIN